ncbi:MAG: hypothetical protein WC749_15730 [Dehalococcoidia bacterium]
MKRLTVIYIVVVAVILLIVSGCETDEGRQAPDDVIPAPGMGLQYRANIHQVGIENPWPDIQSTEVFIGDSSDTARITYRSYIETEAGQTRNNIFQIYLPDVDLGDLNLRVIDVTLTAIDLPAGITATQSETQWHGADPARRSKAFLEIDISKQVNPGEYTFDIDVEIDGKDYGKVPCKVKVIG